MRKIVFLGFMVIMCSFVSMLGVVSAISMSDQKKIGEQIWLNETNKRPDQLVFWHPHEPFPSLGIGHFTWLPKGQKSDSSKQFSLLCTYLLEHGIILPKWLRETCYRGAPWQTREAFLNDISRRQELIALLSSTISLQTSFMIKRLEQEWALILESASIKQKNKLIHYFTLMRSTLLGTYALVDYLNFKGSGKQWGLLGVMQNMPDNVTQHNITKAFAVSAAEVLTIRIKKTGPEYNQLKFLSGWIKRVQSYSDDKLFKA